MWRTTASDQLERADDLNILLHLFFDTDFLPDGDLVRRDIHLFAVNKDVSVPDELPCLGMGRGKTQTHQNVVQAPLQLSQEVLTGNAFLADGFLEVRAELIFKNAVDALHLLLFAKLQSVAEDLRSTPAVLLGGSDTEPASCKE